MYLNLDLLYNVEIYLFPLFYYKSDYSRMIYSPITKKSATSIYYYDHITLNFCWESPEPIAFLKKDFIITETEFIRYSFKYIRCDPFKISKKELNQIIPTQYGVIIII